MTSSTKCARLVAALLITSLSVPGLAFADAAKAAEYYEQATQAYQDGDLEKAADFLNKAYAEDPDLVYQYNRILALQGLGRFEEALQVAAALEAPMKADPQNRFEDISEVRAQLEAEVEKKRQAEQEAQAAETTEPAEPEPTPEPEVEESGPNVLGIALMAGGGVMLIPGALLLGGVFVDELVGRCFGIGTSGSEQAAACADYAETTGDANGTEAFATAKSNVVPQQIAGIALTAVGAVALGVGAYLFFAGDSESAALDADEKPRFVVAPWYAGDSGGAVLHLRF